jgi:hypothetical protein
MKSNFDPRKPQENSDTLPDQAGVYVPPRPVASISEHRTMDIKAIRLAAELDPRQARTQLRIQAPRRRRRVSPFWIASIGVVLLLGVGTYVALVSEIPLPLISSDHPEPEPAPPMAPALPADTLAPPPPTVSAGVDTPAAPLPPFRSASPEPASAAATAPAEPAQAPTPGAAAPAPSPRGAAPRKSKPRRDPWLE